MRLIFIVATLFMIPILIDAFSAFWNFPSQTCQKNHSIDFASYGIQANTNLSFYGDKIVIFYEFIFGRYPYYKGFNVSNPINGGLPQKCNLSDHLKVAEKNITDLIKNATFDGLAIIDFEVWRPLFDQNGWERLQIFQNESIKLVQQENSSRTYNESKLIAEQIYNEKAREFFVKTIQLGRKLRPNATWGFYGFPYCNYNAGKKNETECWQKYRDWNDKMMFLFNESDALFPSIYLGHNATSEERFRYVQAVLKEARRISKKFKPPKPIYAYTKIEYNPLKEIESFYDDHDLCSTIKQPANLGIDGIIFWSSSTNMTLRCSHIKDKIEGDIGLKFKNITQQHESCRKTKCSNHGRCVLQSNTTCPDFNSVDTSGYECECDEGYYGESCSSTSPTR